MKRITIIAAFAMVAFTSASIAAPRQDKQDKKARQEQGEHKDLKDPKKRAAIVADKLNFTADQRAKLNSLNNKYTGDNFDHKAYRQEFRAIMTDAQIQQTDEWKKKHGEGK